MPENQQTEISGSFAQIERLGPCRLVTEIGSGGMGAVWRAEMVEDRPWAAAGSTVAVKVLHAPSVFEGPAFERFSREAAFGTLINHPAVVRTFTADTATIDGKTWRYLVMEYVQGKTIRHLLRELHTLPEPLIRHLGSRVARALAAVHALGAVHRDVKPENVLITHDQVVKLMDFGIARPVEEASTVTETGVFVGTRRYASPEQRLGLELTSASDLYSLGVMLFECATGKFPSDPTDTADMNAPLASSFNAEISPFLDEVLAQLLLFSTRDRFGPADTVADTLEKAEESSWWKVEAAARGITGTRRPLIPVPRSLPLAGRSGPLAQLQQAFAGARSGHGRLLLIEGEAGSGKSRLVAEFVASLESEPVQVLYGSSAPGGVGPGIDALSQAVVGHFGAARLAPGIARHVASRSMVPGFAAVLSGTSAPEGSQPLSPDILVGLFAQLARGMAGQRPVVWIVEDLHFASPLARAIVTALGQAAKDQRLLVIASTRPGLAGEDLDALQRQGGADRIALERLSVSEIRGILHAAFESTAIADELAPRVADKSDGNPLFVSALVDELRLQGLGAREVDDTRSASRSLAQITVPSSISEMLMGRLRELSEADRAILDAAAVQGFEFDGALVARMLKRDALEILQALAGLARRHGVVRSHGALFTFDHHLLHELVHGQIPLALRIEYHAALAQAYAGMRGLSDRRPDEIPGEDAVFMATHLLQGQRLQEGADYVLAAFDHLASSARIGSVLDLANLASERGGAAPGVPPPGFSALRQARWHAHLGDAHWTSGRFPEAERFLERALADLGVDVPRSDLPRKLFILRQAFAQLSHLVLPRALVGASAARQPALREAARTAGLMAMMQVYQSRQLDVLLYALLSVNLGERAGTDSVFSLGLLGFTASSLGMRTQARKYFDRARHAGRTARDRRDLIQAMKFEAVNHYGLGELDAGAGRIGECLELSRDLGYTLGLAEAHGMSALLLEARGRLEEAAQESLLPLTAGECEVSGGHRFFYEHRVARVRIFQGRFDEAADLVAAAKLHAGDGDRLTKAMLRGAEARLAAVTGDTATALTAALDAGQVLLGHESGVPSPCRGALEDPAEVLVEAWEGALKRGGDDARIAEAATAAVARVARFARLYPVCRPSSLILEGRVARIRGKDAAAKKHFEEAATLARRIGMAGEEQRAVSETGRAWPPTMEIRQP